jgi:hypothetical protein
VFLSPSTPFSSSFLPAELYSLLTIALIVAVVAVLIAARRDDDRAGNRPQARYFGAIALVTLFIALYAGFGALGSITDLMVNHKDRHRAIVRGERQLYETEFYFTVSPSEGTNFPVLFPLYDFSSNTNNDQNYAYAVGSGLVALTTGALFVFHSRGRRRLRDANPRSAVVARIDSTYHYGACAVAALTLAVSFTSVGYAVFELIAPGIAGGSHIPTHVNRMEGVSELLTFGGLGLGSALIFRRSWRVVRPDGSRPRSRGSRPRRQR